VASSEILTKCRSCLPQTMLTNSIAPSGVRFDVVSGNNMLLTFFNILGAGRFLLAVITAIGSRTKYVIMVLVL
jgi:hypothetical protein